MEIKDYLINRINLVNKYLDNHLAKEHQHPDVIHQAMRYSLFAGGKRLRPILTIAACEAVGGEAGTVLPTACGIEMIHTYSLIHDDLPAMDNDDYRRGKPTNHKIYGEAIAILAGDGLLTEAFNIISSNALLGIKPVNVIEVITEISQAAGTLGMIGGQVVDIKSENSPTNIDTLRYIHSHKTGALFKAAVRAGGILADASESQLLALTNYAENFGLAFQITDDILDVEGDAQVLGKPVGSDQKNNKATYPAFFGMEQSKNMAKEAVDNALKSIEIFGAKGDVLREIVIEIITRKK